MTDDDVIEAIRHELFRIRARPEDAGRGGINVRDSGSGNATLEGTPRGRDFSWFGEAAEIHRRLTNVLDESGPEGVRSEFA